MTTRIPYGRHGIAVLAACFCVCVAAQADTNIWSGAGGDNVWTNPGNWFGVYSPTNVSQFTNVTATINFNVSTNTAGILLSDTPGSVTITNTAYNMTLSGGYGINVQTGSLTLNVGTGTLGAAQSWVVATGAVLNVGASVSKSTFLLTMTNDGTAAVSGIISGTSGLTKSGAGRLTLGGLNTYSGNTVVTGGTLTVTGTINGGGTVTVAGGAVFDVERSNVTSGKNWNVSGTVSSGSGFYQTLGSLTLSGGTLTATGTDNAQYGYFTISTNRSITATGNSQIIAPGHFTFQGNGGITCSVVNASDTLMISSSITNVSGTAGLMKIGTGLLTLGGTNGYVGPTTIRAGRLALAAGSSLAASSSVSIAAGATFDVSGLGASATYTLGTSASLAASGTGTVIGTSAAAIVGGASGIVSLGSRPITLTYDGVRPALFISQGTLALNGNAFTVNSATPLATGTYSIVQQASGAITSNGTFTVSGTAVGTAGTVASIQISGTNVNLVIAITPPHLAITSVNGGLNPTSGIPFNVVVQSVVGVSTPTNVSTATGVTLSRTVGTGTLGGTLTGTILAGNSSVTISGVTYTKAETGVVVTATRSSGDVLPAGTSTAFTVNAGAATRIALTSGNNQTGNRWAALSNAFVVTVYDANTNPVSGIGVVFAIASIPVGATSQTLSTTNATTTVSGQASTILTLGSQPGTYTVTATSGTLTGSPVTFTATASPSDYTLLASATNEYQICMKCHSGYAWLPGSPPNGISPNGSATTPVQTDCAQEFSPMNRSGHPVVTGLDNYPNSIAVGGKKGLLAGAMKAPWNTNIGQQTMMCSDCHGTDNTNSLAAQGPHGSAAQYMLVGPNAANWPNVTLGNIGTSWCMNCHNNSAGAGHTEGNHSGSQCYVCHIVVPHGGKMSRLIGSNNGTMPSRYAWNNNVGTMGFQSFLKATTGGYSENGNCRTSCGHHGSGPINETW